MNVKDEFSENEQNNSDTSAQDEEFSEATSLPENPEEPVEEQEFEAGNAFPAPEEGAQMFSMGGDFMSQQLTAAQEEAASWREKYVRSVAELENVRRRMREEVQKSQKYGIESFAEDLLSVKDSLEMALKSQTITLEHLQSGLDATLKQLASAFERNRLMEIDPQGLEFNPNVHQAISTVPTDSVVPSLPPNHVAQVLQKGYWINDRILRPALVVVTQ